MRLFISLVAVLAVMMPFANEAFAAGRKPRIALYDTGNSSPKPIAPEVISQQSGWTMIASGQAPASFKGDAVIINKAIAVVVRKSGDQVEVYSKAKDAVSQVAGVVPLGFAAGGKISGVKTSANESGEIVLEVSFQSESGKSSAITVSLKPRESIVKTTPVSGSDGLVVNAPSRIGVLPDFFADDMVIDATAIAVEKTAIPSENFFLNMISGGNAIVGTIWDKNIRDIEMTFEGEAENRVIKNISVPYGKDGKVWVAVLSGPGIWHKVDVTEALAKKVLNLDWKVPFSAKWKTNLMHADYTAQSWECKYNMKKRRKWSGVVGNYNWPTWIDGKEGEHKAHIEFPKNFQKSVFKGPTVVYPIDRREDTPISQFTVVDLMRGSLGMGPCEYIMDVEGQGNNKGLYTCQVYDYLVPLWKAGKRKEEAAFIKKTLNDSIIFVKAIQDRINQYHQFGKELSVYLAEQKTAKPEIAEFITSIETILAKDRNIGGKPANGEARVKQIVKGFIPNLKADQPKKTMEPVARSIRSIGLSQDNRVARCRLVVKVIRQKATLAMAMDPKTKEVAVEIRKRSSKILGKSLGHEMR